MPPDISKKPERKIVPAFLFASNISELAISVVIGEIFLMGMQGCFISLSERDLDSVFEDPSRLQILLEIEGGTEVGQEVDEIIEKLGEFAAENDVPEEVRHSIKGLRDSREERDDSWEPEAKPEFLDIDKSWHGIHFLLTGSHSEGSGPLAFILQGGREIPTDDFGYGPPHAFTATEVREINQALNRVSPDELYSKADPDQFTELDIYPGIWDSEPKEESIGYLTDYLKELQTFIKQAAASDRALIAYIG